METGNDKIMKRNRELARRPIMSTQIAENLNIPDDQWITASVSGTGNIIGNRSQTLIANSAWSQVNGCVPFGTSFGSLVTVRNYRGGTSEIWNGYGGFASTYCGTESQSWNDPSIASYDARNLNGTRFTPHNPPGVPAPQLFSTPSMKFVMPPALVEDTEAAAGQKQTWLEWAVDQGVGFIPVYGSARDAYRAYLKGDKIGLAFNLGMLAFDVLTLGGGTVAKVGVKSAIRTGKKGMMVAGKKMASFGDDAARLVRNRIDNVPLFNQGIRSSEVADISLLRKLESRGYAIDQSDEIVRHLDRVGANASTFGTKDLLLRPDARKLEVLEEYLHNVQFKIGLQKRLSTGPTGGLELHVKEFMLRHRRLLGLSDADAAWLANWLSQARIINEGVL